MLGESLTGHVPPGDTGATGAAPLDFPLRLFRLAEPLASVAQTTSQPSFTHYISMNAEQFWRIVETTHAATRRSNL
jgi:hypothetical protein